MARGLKFGNYEIEGLYYLCSENKGTDQLRGYREADLRLCVRICKNSVFSRLGSFFCYHLLVLEFWWYIIKKVDIQLILFEVHIYFLFIYIYKWTFECYLDNQVLGAITAIIYYEPKRSWAEMAMGRNEPEPVRRGPKQTWFVQPQTASSLIFRIYAPIICIPPPHTHTHLRGWVGKMTVPFRI